MSRSLGLIGCGKMAYALMKGIGGAEFLGFDSLLVNDIDPERGVLFQEEFNAIPTETGEVLHSSRVIILAVKPQQVRMVLDANRAWWTTEHLLISLAAGIKTGSYENEIGLHLPVVRVMPNTPCLVGQGVSAISAGRYAADKDLQLVAKMFEQLGTCVMVEEKHMDAVTAISGSGPAYVFLVVESLMNAALQVGLDLKLARQLLVNTVKGSMEMMEQSGEHPAILREQVCSPGGTTIAGIRQLEENGLRRAFFQAVEKAYERSIELGKD